MTYKGRGFASDKGGIVDMWWCESCSASIRELVPAKLFNEGNPCPECARWIDDRKKGTLINVQGGTIGLRCTVCGFATCGGQG